MVYCGGNRTPVLGGDYKLGAASQLFHASHSALARLAERLPRTGADHIHTQPDMSLGCALRALLSMYQGHLRRCQRRDDTTKDRAGYCLKAGSSRSSGPHMQSATRKARSQRFAGAAGVILTFAGLALLTGCQGVSSGHNDTQVSPGQLSISPSTVNIGTVATGSSGSGSGLLTASGANITVTAASISNSAFSVGGLSLPVTITAGQSIPFTITFSPQAAGSISATLTVTSDAQPSTATETLTGSGAAASTHTVDLSWTASTSSNITGYNVYRAVYTTSCGPYTKINSALNTTTLYTDSSVVNGTSYCYAATAVNTSNEESGYSNIVSNVQIPSS